MYNIDREINFHQHICSCTHRSINRKHYHKITNSNNWREFRKSVDTYIAPILHLDGMFSSTASAYEKLTSSLSSCSTAFFFIISEEFGTSPGSRADTKFIYVVCFQQTNFSLKDITGSLEITPWSHWMFIGGETRVEDITGVFVLQGACPKRVSCGLSFPYGNLILLISVCKERATDQTSCSGNQFMSRHLYQKICSHESIALFSWCGWLKQGLDSIYPSSRYPYQLPKKYSSVLRIAHDMLYPLKNI